MPCSDGGVPYGPTAKELAAEREREAAERERERLNPLLCSACRSLERLGYDFDENAELSEWWDAHKKADEARVARELEAKKRAEWEQRQLDAALTKSIVTLTQAEKSLLKKFGYM